MEIKDSKERLFTPEAILLKSPFKILSIPNTPNLNSVTRIYYQFNNGDNMSSPQIYLQKLK